MARVNGMNGKRAQIIIIIINFEWKQLLNIIVCLDALHQATDKIILALCSL